MLLNECGLKISSFLMVFFYEKNYAIYSKKPFSKIKIFLNIDESMLLKAIFTISILSIYNINTINLEFFISKYHFYVKVIEY